MRNGERLIWSGRPRQGVRLRVFDFFLIPFTLIWLGTVIFGFSQAISMALRHKSTGSMIVLIPFFLMFLGFGCFIAIGRFWFDIKMRAGTFYGVTSERVLIVSGLFDRKVQSLDLASLPELTFTETSNGAGSIEFESIASETRAPARFDQIERVREVYNMIGTAQRERF